jgi:invasion protein IalB
MPSRILLVAVLAVLAPALALAQQQQPQQGGARPAAPAGPSRLGEHGAWTAATHVEGGQKVCYAFARPARSEPQRQNVMLTVTHRPSQRDAVILTAGHAYPANAGVKVSVGGRDLDFYTAGSAAAARDHAAAVRAFRNGREAVARGPGPNGRGTATDTFSLAGFGAAYDAISRECPAGGGRR